MHTKPKYSPLDIPRLEKRKPSKRLKRKLAELRTITMVGIATDNFVRL